MVKNQIDPITNYKISRQKYINERSCIDNVQPNIKLNIQFYSEELYCWNNITNKYY